MIRGFVALALLLSTPAFAAEEPAEATVAAESTVEPAPGELAEDLEIQIQSAARMGEKQGVLVALNAANRGRDDLLLLLSEAHVVPPDSMEAACSPLSPRFPTIPLLQITRSETPGTTPCDGSQRVPKADWVLSVMRLPVGKSATIVVQILEPAPWAGDLFAHLGISYTTADRANDAELKRTERIGLGMMITGLEPGGRIVAPGEGGPSVQRAVALFDRRVVAAPALVD